MKTRMFELVHSFWKMAEQEAFTPSEAALYFFLLDRANSQKWQMPIRCPTETIKAYLATSKQNVVKARDGLKERDVIDFSPGKGKGSTPAYILLPSSHRLSDGLSDGLSVQLSPYKNKEKDSNSIDNACEEKLNIEELERRFLSDEPWQENVASHMSSMGFADLTLADMGKMISQFFFYLKITDIEKREEKECRKHFVNWLSMNLNKTKFQNNGLQSCTKNKSAQHEADSSPRASYSDPF